MDKNGRNMSDWYATGCLPDSGKREEYSSGAVRDVATGKGRFDLLPPHALMRLAQLYEVGATKYAARNWEKGIPLDRFIDSAFRHMCCYNGDSFGQFNADVEAE
jgi:hypothetical protein